MIKLAHVNIETQILLTENYINTLAVESPTLFYKYVEDLSKQINEDEEGEFVFSKGNEILTAAKACAMIIDFFHIDHNSKKVINALYKDLSMKIKSGESLLELENINAITLKLLLNAEMLTDLPIVYDSSLDIANLLKLYNVRIEESYVGILENLISYVNILVEIFRTEVLCLVNAKSYLTEEEIEQLSKHCAYQKVSLLLLESTSRTPMAGEKVLIIDKDLCELVVNYSPI